MNRLNDARVSALLAPGCDGADITVQPLSEDDLLQSLSVRSQKTKMQGVEVLCKCRYHNDFDF